MATVQVNKENLKAVIDYMYLDEYDFFLEENPEIVNLDDFFKENPDYNESIMYHLHELSKSIED